MKIRDAVARDLQSIVGICISAVPARVSTAGIFARNEGLGFETWARLPKVADHDGVEE